jgi:antitoxin YefM
MTALIPRKARASRPRVIDQAAALRSVEDRRAIQETVFLVGRPHLRKSIRSAMSEPLSKSVRKLLW